MRFSPEFIEKVAESNNIVDILSQYTNLKSSSSGYMGRCPFPDHPEKTPSFSVSETKQVYFCFGCHKKGNVFTFLQQYNGMSFLEAVEYLASRSHIALPTVNNENTTKGETSLVEKKRQLAKINKHASSFFQETLTRLPKTHLVWQYLENRGLNKETIETFSIGYAPEEWDALGQHLQSKLISLNLAEEARLVKARSGDKGGGYFDIFRDRLMFPIRSPLGETVAFGGRVIQQGEPKYLNSPETVLFQKGRVLYGLFETAKYIRSEDVAIVVEGYMDLISLYQAGIRNVVATMGTALTLDHGKLLRRLTKNVVILFDGDLAGQEATERSLPLLLQSELYPKGLTLPNDLDPDDYVKQFGADRLRTLIQRSGDLFSLVLSQWVKSYRGEASEKIQLCDRVAPILNIIQDLRLKQLYVNEVATKLEVTDHWLKQAICGPKKDLSFANKAQPDTSKNVPNEGDKLPLVEEEIEKIKLGGATKAEILLMALILRSRTHFLAFLKSDILDLILHEGIKKVLERAAGVYRQAPEKFDKLMSLLTSYVDQPDLLFVPDILLKDNTDSAKEDGKESELEIKLLQDCLKRVRKQHIQYRIHQISQDIKLNPSPEKLEQLMILQREKRK